MNYEELYDEANGEVAVGNLEQATTLYRQSVELNPGFIDGWQSLAMAYIKPTAPKRQWKPLKWPPT